MTETSITDFTRLEWQWLADLITEKLCEQGIEVSAFAFSIEVTYNEEENEDIETLGCDDSECECRRDPSWPDNLPCTKSREKDDEMES